MIDWIDVTKELPEKGKTEYNCILCITGDCYSKETPEVLLFGYKSKDDYNFYSKDFLAMNKENNFECAECYITHWAYINKPTEI